MQDARPIPRNAKSTAYLLVDNWNDWYEFKTLFVLFWVDANGNEQRIGEVKIGQDPMPVGNARPTVPSAFDALPEEFFSLGQDDSYYEALKECGDQVRAALLRGLRDVALDQELFRRVETLRVTEQSLLRSVHRKTVTTQFARIASGGSRLTAYDFSFQIPGSSDSLSTNPILSFEVRPNSTPPTNIHVVIGRNGVGKTRLLNAMCVGVTAEGSAGLSQIGERAPSTDEDFSTFANVVSVSFSAFDRFSAGFKPTGPRSAMPYTYIGLKRAITTSNTKPTDKASLSVPIVSTNSEDAMMDGQSKSTAELAHEFAGSVSSVWSHEARRQRWNKALETLGNDPVFESIDVYGHLLDISTDSDTNGDALFEELIFGKESPFRTAAQRLFDSLSSGHKVVLLTITRLIETVEERTLVVLDEPEAHLHPPLLSAFIRALSDLLTQRNGVAIVATHSPVVLQEVPRTCAWKLRRNGETVVAERPSVETFGENVGVLTRDVFQLELTGTGFHKMLKDSVDRHRRTVDGAEDSDAWFEDVESEFSGQLGEEARSIVYALITSGSTRAQ